MDDFPKYKSGDHVFSKGPHREKWDGWKWDDLYRQAVDALPNVSPDNCALENMVQSEFVKGWNREQAEELMRRAAQASANAPAQPNPMSTLKDDMDMNLDSVPF